MRNSGADPLRRPADPLRPRLLVVGVDWLGDALFMTPVFRALKRRWPDSFLAATSASRNRPVLSRCPHLDEVRDYDEVPFLLGLRGQWDLSRWMRSRGFDTALFLHRSFTRTLAAFGAGIPERVGFAGSKRDALLTRRLEAPPRDSHRADVYLSVLRPLGVEPDGRHPEVRPLAEDREEWLAAARRAGWADPEPYTVLHPGGNWDLKRWPVDHFAELASRLAASGKRVAVCGSAHEAPLGDRIARAWSGPRGRVLSFCGRTSFSGLVGMLAAADQVISNDSGPLHLAAALNTPVLGLFGPTLASITGPIGGPAAAVRTVGKDFGCELPCYFKRCVNRVCLDRLSVDEVADAADFEGKGART